jgi:L-aminopeptidase/D-esterase-like protein
VQGVQVGHFTSDLRPTGCSVVLTPEGAVAAVDVRGAAPGTRETDLLRPGNLVEQVHAIVLSGGSAWGLSAATGVAEWLEEQGYGLDVGVGRVPIVPAAVLFDLPVGNASIRPDAAAGRAACEAATSTPCATGNVGAGAGATVGKLFGHACAMKGGIGSASVSVHGVTVGALIAVNAVGDVLAPDGSMLAGARTADGKALRNTAHTIGVIATDAQLDKAQLQRLALAGHDGLARCISPIHTLLDGDTLFAVSTAASSASAPPDMITLAAMAAEATMQAVQVAISSARGIRVGELELPAAGDWKART